MIYLDHAASTPPHPDVIRTINEIMQLHYGNPSSLHRPGEESAKLLQKAREVSAAAVGVDPEEIVFTSGATESNNLAIKGTAFQFMNRGKHIVTTAIEHPSVYETCRQLADIGFEVTFLPVDEKGCVRLDELQRVVRKDTILVSVMQVNNEVGSIQPVAEIGRWLKEHFPRTLFHVDGVQGFGKLSPLQLKPAGIDLYSISAHKLGGPRGAGLLVVRKGLRLFPLLAGGGQEGGLRSGTENIPAFVGMAKALRLAKEDFERADRNWKQLQREIRAALTQIPGLVVNSPEEGASHILHFSYPGMKPEVLLHCLEEEGVVVSTKSACSSKISEPSRVLTAMGASLERASSGIRVSFGRTQTREDGIKLITALRAAITRLEGLKGGVK